MTFHKITKKHGIEIFLVNFYPQQPFLADYFRKTTGMPIVIKCLLYGQPFFGRQGAGAVNIFEVQEFLERKWEQFPGNGTAPHLGRYFPGQHPRG
ncbi:MAG: hypothetical protein ACNA7H_07950 [Desulfotignum sp.]